MEISAVGGIDRPCLIAVPFNQLQIKYPDGQFSVQENKQLCTVFMLTQDEVTRLRKHLELRRPCSRLVAGKQP